MMVAVPVRGGGQVTGALVGELDLQRDTRRGMEPVAHAQGDTVSLIDAASTVIYDLDPKQIGRTVQQDSPQLWQMVLAGEPDSRLFDIGQLPREVIAYAPVPGIAWGLILRESSDAIMAQTRPLSGRSADCGWWGSWLRLWCSRSSVRRALLPLDAVITEARNVAEGGTFNPLPEAGPPDIRTLVAALNRMVAQLTRSRPRYATTLAASYRARRRSAGGSRATCTTRPSSRWSASASGWNSWSRAGEVRRRCRSRLLRRERRVL